MDENYGTKTFTSSYLYFKKVQANFADIIKIATIFIRKNFKECLNLKEIEIMHENAIFICISYSNKSCRFLVKNDDVSKTQRVCHVIYTFFGSSLGKVQVCQVSLLLDMSARFQAAGEET